MRREHLGHLARIGAGGDRERPGVGVRGRCPSRRRRRARAARGSPRTGGWTDRRRGCGSSTSSASRSGSSRATPRKPSATCACSMCRRSTTPASGAPSGATRDRRRRGLAAGEALLHLGHDVLVVDRSRHRHDHRRRSVPAVEEARTSSGVMASTESAVPAVSRPRGWSGNSASASRRCATSSGRSSSIASSSRMTWRSLSTSPSRNAGAVSTSQRSSTASWQVLGRHPAVVRRVLLGREGVDVAAHAVDGRRDARARCGPRSP